MSSNNSSGRNNILFSNAQRASNDLFTGLLTEDNTASGIRFLDVMVNDQGSGKSLYSLDDGNNRLKDLLVQDIGRTEPLSTDKSAMGATIWITNDGKVGYDASSFSAATLARLNHLSAGESLTDTFTYAIRLSDGTLSWATASVKIDGVNDPAVITSGAQNGAATEIADGALGENAAMHTSLGVITFTDAEKHDSHTVSVAPNGAGYLGTFKAYLADGDDDDHHDDGDRRGGDRNESGSDADAVKWKFSVNDSALDHLAAGQTLTQTYNVVINDGHGGTTTQVVTITLTGSNDGPVITSAAQSGNVSEGDDGASMTATGQVIFSDVDLIDTHAFTVSVAAAHGTAGVDASGHWTYTAIDSGAVDALAAGEHLADSFTVQVDDHHGGLASQVVNIDIAGTNDGPVITSTVVDAAGAVQEDTALIATGQLTASDIDHNATQAWSIVGTDTGSYGSLAVDAATGQWTYTLANGTDGVASAVQSLAQGESHDETFTVRVTDDKGATADQVVTITVAGTNDGPVAVADTNALDAVVEAGVTPGAGDTAARGLVGTWLGNGSDFSALTLFADGRYMFMEGGGGQPPDGGEAGNWVYDTAAGKLALYASFDGNIGGGLAPDQNGIFNPVTFSASELSLTVSNNGVPLTLVGARQAVNTGIAGTWLNTPTDDAPFTALVLFDDHRFMYMEGGGLPPNGLEAGTYSYDAVSGDLVFTTTFDSNNGTGIGGLSPTLDGVTLSAIVNGDTLSVTGAPTAFLPMHRQFSSTPGTTIDPAYAGDATAGGNVLANDSDVDVGAILALSEVNGLAGKVGVTVVGTYGSVVIGSDGNYTYTLDNADPDTNALAQGASASDVFSYTVTDEFGAASSSTLTIDITGTNDGPVAVADTNTLNAVVEAGALQPAAASSMVGTFLGDGAPFSVLSLFADGRYMYMEGDGQAPNGGEAGTWVYDAAAGKLALNCAFDNNIGGGLAPDQNGIFNPVTFNGAQVGLTIFNPDLNATVTLTGTRQAVGTGIAGTWLGAATADEPFYAMVLFDDHRFMYMEGAGRQPNGLEAGTYTYDPLSGALTFTTTFDNNSDGGVSPGVNGVALTAVINGDTLFISNGDFHLPPLSRQFSDSQNATIDPAVAGDATAVGNVLANDTDVDAGAHLTVSEVNGFAGNVGTTIVGTYGSVVIGSDGNYSYTLDNADPDTNALAQGASASDVFSYTVTDEFGATSSSTLTIAIAGANDAPVAVNNTGSATEKGGIANGSGGSNAIGNVLVNDTDADTAHASLTVTAVRTGFTEGLGIAGVLSAPGVPGTGLAGAHGTLFMNASGGYSYIVKEFDPAVQALNSTGPNTSLTDVFNYTVSDGGRTDTAVLTVTIHGANDAPVVTSPVTLTAMAEDSGARLITHAQLLAHASDVDSPGLSAINLAIASGNGALVNNNDGTWSYTPALNDDTAVTFSYGVTDGVAPAVTASAALDITPVNDIATIAGVAAGSVTEDGTLTAGGVLTVADVDSGESYFQTPASLAGTYGAFTFNAASGAWGYTLNNSAINVQALGATDVAHDTMTVTSLDGTASQNIDVTIAGADEAPAGLGRALAVAYNDQNGNNIYDAATDTLYFGVFDTNGDNAFSAGDTLRADFYPANVAASTMFEFQNKDHVIMEADWYPASHGLKVFAGDELVVFSKDGVGEMVTNYTLANYFSGGPGLGLLDLIDWPYPTGPLASADEVGIEAGWAADSTLMPTGPDTAVNSQLYQNGSQHWLNVDFLV